MNKKIFISYSWGSMEHQQWVIDLATRLMNDTVDVVLDKWSLKDGHDIYSFMEEMVKADDVFRVIIVSDKKYSIKANDRTGGVGTETQIITPNLYSNEKQEKFIPIVTERDEENEPYLPIYLKSRKYIDFSKVEHFENSYEELLRNILEAPAIPKPKLGNKPPAYITESKVNLSETHGKIKLIENQLFKNNTVSYKELSNFLDIFSERLGDFELKSQTRDLLEFGDILLDNLKSYKLLREDFIKFIDLIVSGTLEDIDELLVEFFETAPSFNKPRKDLQIPWSPSDFEIFKIIFQELFIYTIAITLKNKNYNLVADLLHSRYYIKEEYRLKQAESFCFLYSYHENLENYMSEKYNKITGFGDYIITNLSESVSKSDIILADTLCYFVSYLDQENNYKMWFPNTYLYGERFGDISFFQKISSKKHFEKTKQIFNVDNEEELRSKLEACKLKSKDRMRYARGSFETIPFLYEIVNPETIAIYK